MSTENKDIELRDNSRRRWCIPEAAGSNHEILRTGAMLRIADAMERVATEVGSVSRQRDQYERWYQAEKAKNRRLRKRLKELRKEVKP